MRLLRHLIRWFILGMIALLLAVACSQRSDRLSVPPHPLADDCRAVQHAMGETCVPAVPERVATLNPAALGNAIALGIQPAGSVEENDNEFPAYLKGQVEGIESLGTWSQPNIERIARLKPDVIIGWKHNQQAVYPQLKTIASTALYDWVSNIKSEDNWKKYSNFMAKVLGKENISQQLWQHYNQRIEQLKAAVSNRYKDSTFSVVTFCCGGIYLDQGNSFISSIFSDAGLQLQKHNLPSRFMLSEETLDLLDGDVLFVIAFGGKHSGQRDLSNLQQKPLWKKLKSVQQNRVYYVEPTTWGSGRNLLAADAVIDDLYKYLVNPSQGEREQ